MRLPSFRMITNLRIFSRFALVAFAAIFLASCDSLEDRIQSHFQKGLELYESGEKTKAGLEFRNALQLNNDFVPALFLLAKVEFQAGEILRAVGFFQKVTEIDGNHIESRIELAKIFLLANRIDDSERYADQAQALDPDNLQVMVTKGAIALKRKSYDEATRLADIVLEKEPTNADALIIRASERIVANDPAGALTFLNKGSPDEEGYTGIQFLKLTAFEKLDDKEGIEQVFNLLVERDPKNVELRYSLSRWYAQNDRKDDAEHVIRDFTKENPDNVKAGLQLVGLVRTLRGNDAAVTELQALIKSVEGPTFDYKLALSELKFLDGNEEEAITSLQRLIKEQTDTENASKARLFLANKLISLNRRDEANDVVIDVLENDDKNPSALEIRGALLIDEGKDDEAIEHLIAALDLKPRSSKILRLLALAYERTGKVSLAEDNLVKAAQIEEFKPQQGLNLTAFLFRHGKVDHAENVLSQIVDRTPNSTEALVQLARIKLRKGDWAGAELVAANLAKGDEKSRALAEKLRISALAGQRKYDESISALKKSLAAGAGESDDTPQANLLKLYLKAKKFDEAEELIFSSLEAKPDDPASYVRLGLLRFLQDRFDDAEDSYLLAIEKSPQSMTGYYALSDFYLRRGQVDDSIKIARKGLDIDRSNAGLHLLLAQTLEKTGDVEAAIQEYEILYEKNPLSVVVANNLASLISEHRTSKEDLQRAYDIAAPRFRNSRIPQFLDTLGWINYLRGEYGEAISSLRIAAERLPNDGTVQYHLGMTYKALGRSEQAMEVLQRAEALLKGVEFTRREQLNAALQDLKTDAEAQTKVQ